jgi:hypothetical protein
MRSWLLGLVVCALLVGCSDDPQAGGGGTGTVEGNPDDSLVCVGDPDSQVVCTKASDFWDCTAMPNGDVKCNYQEPQKPNGTNAWTCTLQDGKIVCTTPTSGATPTGGSGWSCYEDDAGGTTCEKTAPTPPGGGSFTCTLADDEFTWTCTGTEVTPPTTPPPGSSSQLCFEVEPGTTGMPVPPEGYWAKITAKKVLYNGVPAAYIHLVLTKAFVDNTYGEWAIGYHDATSIGGGHSFNDLVESDKMEIFVDDTKGNLSFHMALDYISQSSSAPSGYASLGVSGGEGQVLTGQESDVLGAQTSLSVNLNANGPDYVLLKDSPETDLNYTPNPKYPKWIFDVWYEAWVKWSAFGSTGPGKVYITGLHASPNKTAEKKPSVVQVPCP